MIELQGVSKWYRVKGARHYILRDVTCVFPKGSVGILGRNGAGKSTMVRLLGGTEMPSEGRVVHKARVSWPLGLSGSFQGRLTGRENCSFVCRIYGHDRLRVVGFVEEFSQLGRFLDMPVQTYSSGMRARLGFALSLAIEFEVYLIDEVTEVGDADFRKKCRAALEERRERSSVIIVSHSPKTIRELCQSVALLKDARLEWYQDVQAGLAAYEDV